MLKILRLILCLSLLLANVNFAKAEGTSVQILAETVKIISYHLTANNHVIEKSFASGTLISADGLILTNHHVVTDENEENYDTFAICAVTDLQKKPECLYTASLVDKDKSLDAALLKINAVDIYGKAIPDFSFLNYQNAVLPATGDRIKITGFPGIGGDTVTETEGQVSGYDENEGIKQMKTDATISAGNSGGTAEDAQGNFIGVPSYLKSYISSIGYIIPLVEIEPWLRKVIAEKPQTEEFAQKLLDQLLAIQHTTEQNQRYVSENFPFYQVDLPENWKIAFLNETNLDLTTTIKGFDLSLDFKVEIMPYAVTADFMAYVFKKIEKYQHFYINYQRKNYTFQGAKGYLLSYDSTNYRNYYFLAPLQNTFFSYNYQVPLDEVVKTEEAIQNVLQTFRFLSGENKTALKKQIYTQKEPSISLQTQNDFYIAPMADSQEEDVILTIYNPQSFEQSLQLFYEEIPSNLRELEKKRILEEELKNQKYSQTDFKLINKNENVILDGLAGFAYSFSYQGANVNETRKQTNVVVFAGEKDFRFMFDNLAKDYDRYLNEFIFVLKTFTYEGAENRENKGVYTVPQFKMYFNDLLDYPYEREINALIDRKILNFSGRYFYPEKPLSRLQALEIILNSKIFIEEDQKLTQTQEGIRGASRQQIFSDQNESRYNQLFNYAVQKEIIAVAEKFYPSRDVILPEALKMLCQTFEVQVWTPPYEGIPWYVPYLYKGYSLGVIPGGASFNQPLTRGQFAALVFNFLTVVGEREDL